MEISGLVTFLNQGGPVIWTIAFLSLFTVTLILWKLLQLVRAGAWGGAMARRAVEDFRSTRRPPDYEGSGLRFRAVCHAIGAVCDPRFSEAAAREETERYARTLLNDARSGLRALDVVATVAPLLGLLGTVLGMIEAFQALQASGARADPSTLAGGIWEALLTTAAGMAVAIPAALALAWFESIIDSVAADIEDLATQVFLSSQKTIARAAE